MKPFNYYKQIIRMKFKVDKFDLRLRIIKHALAYGVKPTARVFETTTKTIRKWLKRQNSRPTMAWGSLAASDRIKPTTVLKESSKVLRRTQTYPTGVVELEQRCRNGAPDDRR